MEEKNILSIKEASDEYVKHLFGDKKDEEVANIAKWDFQSGGKYVVDALCTVLETTQDVEIIKKTLKFLSK